MSELAIINMNLPARVWLPTYDFAHHVVRIPFRSAAVLNSKDKVRVFFFLEENLCKILFYLRLHILFMLKC